jgi:hypothetical protein
MHMRNKFEVRQQVNTCSSSIRIENIPLIIVRTSETMKVLSLSFSLFALASTASVKTPRFSLISERSANGAPTVAVTFPNGHSDTLVLSPFTDGITDTAKNCRYSGNFLRGIDDKTV